VDLPSGATAALDRVAARLQEDEQLHVEVFGFAAARDASSSRRLSLSRALSVRNYLSERGVRAQRIELRPLGTPADGPPDRIDLRLARR
jgi:outer membrane protein OmpA-like peptidoglycan-associated protein